MLATAPAIATTAQTPAAQTATATPGDTLQQRLDAILASPTVSDEVKAKVREISALLPSDFSEQMATTRARLGVGDTQWSQIAASAIDPDDYECSDTQLRDWMRGQTSDWGFAEVLIYSFMPWSDFVTYDALVYGSESKTATFGSDGEYTNLLRSQMKDLRDFWDVPGQDIELIPMHGGDVFADQERFARVLTFAFSGDPDEPIEPEVRELAGLLIDLLDVAPGLSDGNHPIFSFNAFAFDPQDTGLDVSKRIIMGDGIMEGMTGVGVGPKVGPRSILAHEYGHQVQYAHNLFESDLTGPEATRRTELMADAYGAYFLVHARGEALNQKRTLDGLRASYLVGDCGFTNPGHHGTPNQRAGAASWAVKQVNSAPDQGHILPTLTYADRFDAALPMITAPDAEE
ncbi:hypothetical protein ASG73_06535 [Janibacter sp. Soil728]|nr:hypothetical protein ASG73_06535 [Janibacter sp. Soil728]